MKRPYKIGLIAVGIFFYLVVGWKIGNVKYDLWHGNNGYAALKDLKKANHVHEALLRMYYFPVSTFDASYKDSWDEDKGNVSSSPLLLVASSRIPGKQTYAVIHAVIGPVGSLVWALCWTVIYVVLFGLGLPFLWTVLFLGKVILNMFFSPFGFLI